MNELWNNVTVAQALLVVVAAWLLVRLGEAVTELVRRVRGTYRPGDHCDHCPTVDALDEHVAKLLDYAHDQLAVLEEIRDNTRRTAATLDELAADENPVTFR